LSRLEPRPEATEDDIRLAEQLRALQRFRAAIEHELRSPLNSVALTIELLAVETAGAEPAADSLVRESIAGLAQGVARLSRCIESILAILPTRGTEPDPLDFAELMRGIAGLCGLEARLMRVRFETEIPAGAAILEARRDLCQQALLLIAAEALDSARSGGRITFSLDVGEEEAEALFAVEPCREPAPAGAEAREPVRGLASLSVLLGASFEDQRAEDVRRLRLRIPRTPGGAAEC